mmetsp:Transcript_2814/g.8806  ORF Transcript_2814/g.8806 Transcript_2814/m.8806 type:complete len:88 (+) Transcript_2814:151-414(+)
MKALLVVLTAPTIATLKLNGEKVVFSHQRLSVSRGEWRTAMQASTALLSSREDAVPEELGDSRFLLLVRLVSGPRRSYNPPRRHLQL